MSIHRAEVMTEYQHVQTHPAGGVMVRAGETWPGYSPDCAVCGLWTNTGKSVSVDDLADLDGKVATWAAYLGIRPRADIRYQVTPDGGAYALVGLCRSCAEGAGYGEYTWDLCSPGQAGPEYEAMMRGEAA